MSDRLAGKVALITGAGSGIGLATANRFLSEGATVIAGDINLEALETIRSDKALVPVQLDVRSVASVEGTVDGIAARFGRVDILVNSAAIIKTRSSFLSVSDADWLASIEVNLLGYVRTSRAVIRLMLEKDGGTIIHMASEAAQMPNLDLPDYSVLKSSVLGLSKFIARQYGQHRIRSNVVSPAFIRTPVYDRPGGMGEMLERKYGVGREQAYERYVDEVGVAVGRLGTPGEVAALAAFLATSEAEFITGANYLIDGGVTPFV